MQIDLVPILIFLVTLVTTTAVTFYVKDYLQKKSEYTKLRRKLEKIAGKHAQIVYTGAGFGMGANQLFKITDIDEHGITIQNELQTIFIPAAKLISSEMVLPCENYEEVKLKKLKEDMEKLMDNLIPAMFNRMFPSMMEAIRNTFSEELLEEEGEISAVFAIKMQKMLKEEGFQLKKITSGNKS